MTSFSGEEVAAVLAAALLALDDDAQLDVVVHLPDGTQSPIDRAWYEPSSGRIVIETERTAPRLQPTWNWTDDPHYPDWSFLMDSQDRPMRRRRRRRAQPLNDVTSDDLPGPNEPETPR